MTLKLSIVFIFLSLLYTIRAFSVNELKYLIAAAQVKGNLVNTTLAVSSDTRVCFNELEKFFTDIKNDDPTALQGNFQ